VKSNLIYLILIILLINLYLRFKLNEEKIPKKKKVFAEHKPIFVGTIIAAIAIAGIVSGVVLFRQ